MIGELLQVVRLLAILEMVEVTIFLVIIGKSFISRT